VDRFCVNCHWVYHTNIGSTGLYLCRHLKGPRDPVTGNFVPCKEVRASEFCGKMGMEYEPQVCQ
jgi:hypothetical protein